MEFMPLILDKDNILDWIRPNGNSSAIVEKALEYHRTPTEFIAM